MAQHDMAMSDCVWDMGNVASERRMISVRSVMLWLSELEGVGCQWMRLMGMIIETLSITENTLMIITPPSPRAVP